MIYKIRRSLLPCIIMMLVLCCIPVYAAPAVSKKEALKIARRYIPSGSKLTESEWEKSSSDWEFEFLTKNRKIKYEVAVDGISGKLLELEKEYRCFSRTYQYSVSKKAAKKIILKSFKDAKIAKIVKKTWKGTRVYKITFTTPTYRATAVVHGGTGKIIEWEKKFS